MVKRLTKRFMAFFLALVFTAALLPTIPAMAAESGTCGENVTWTLDDSGTLTISGTGEMENYSSSSDAPWCSNRKDIKTAVIENGVTNIGSRAFYGCRGLTSVTIPDSVTSIGGYAFYGCTGLTSVTIPDSVTSIGVFAFKGCTGLTSVTIPDSVISIDSFAFSGSGLTSITIPDSITSIENSTFSNCRSLTSITIPDSVTSIGDSAFQSCSGLTNIDVDKNNENYCSVDGNLFNKDKTKLIQYAIGKTDTSYTIPDSVTSIGYIAFSYCTNLTSIDVDKDNKKYCSIDGNLFSKDKTKLIQYAIGKKETVYTIPDSVTSIGYNAFCRCTSLISITIPDSVTSIGKGAFQSCSGLTRITIPNSVTSIGYWAFEGCTGLTNVTIPNSVTSIGNDAFSGCTGLTRITMPNSVTSISEYAFEGCSSLTSVTIPDSVTYIGLSAFDGCTSLTDVYYKGTEEQWNAINIDSGNDPLTSATIHYSYTPTSGTCGENATWTIDDDGTLTISGTGEMENYSSSSDAPWYGSRESITKIVIENGVTSISDWAFYDCDSASQITIPESVTRIGNFAFQFCDSLSSIKIGSKVAFIGKYVFASCHGLTAIDVNESNADYSSADGVLFNKDKTELIQYPAAKEGASYTIPDGVTTIMGGAFEFSKKLTELNIPDSVDSVGTIEFRFSDKLENINVAENNATYSSADGVLFNKDKTELLIYPKAKQDNEYTIPDTVEVIGEYAFFSCDNIQSVTIPDSVTAVSDNAFDECSELKKVNLGKNVKSIGNYAFFHCYNIGSIAIPDSVTTIGGYAFQVCEGLQSVILGVGLTDVEIGAFAGCTALTDVYYKGTEEQWNAISISSYNDPLTSATIHYSYTPTTAEISPIGKYADKLDIVMTKTDGNVKVEVTTKGDTAISSDEIQVFAMPASGSATMLTPTANGDTIVYSGNIDGENYRIFVWTKDLVPITNVIHNS